MTVKELLEVFNNFISNDFNHLRDKVDSNAKTTARFFVSLIIGLLGIIGGLTYLILVK